MTKQRRSRPDSQAKGQTGAPRTAVSACPRLDKLLKGNLAAQTKSKDKAMAKSQALLLDAVGPLTFLLEELDKGTLTPQTTREAAQTALKLLGNASCHISADRRKNVLGDLNPRLTDVADEDEQYREAPPNLFGDELKALQKATSHSRPYQKTDSRAPQAGKVRFFRGSRPSTYTGRGGSYRGSFRGRKPFRSHPYQQKGNGQERKQNSNQ